MENKNSNAQITSTTNAVPAAEDAAAAIPIEALAPMRIDPARAAVGVLGVLPQIERVRPEVVAIFGDEGNAKLDALDPAATAAFKANAAYRAGSDIELETAASALAAKRDQLRLVAEAAIERGIIKPNALQRLIGGNSYDGLSTDTTMLCTWVDAHREKLGEHCKVSAEETAQIATEALAFARANAERPRQRIVDTEVGLKRARAFTHLLEVYDLARQLIGYTRWHQGDADTIAPSLYAGRARKSDALDEEPTDAEPNPVMGPALSGGPVAPAPVVTPVAPAPEPAPVNPIPPGFPGADPFIRNP